MSRVNDQLSDRDREILREVIQTYLSSGEPVSSRRVAKDRQVQLSAATIRNVMADLEDMGYLRQPHVSAGRLPTEAGFHLFIDDLMSAEVVSDDDRRLIDDRLTTAGGYRPGTDRGNLETALAALPPRRSRTDSRPSVRR